MIVFALLYLVFVKVGLIDGEAESEGLLVCVELDGVSTVLIGNVNGWLSWLYWSIIYGVSPIPSSLVSVPV